MVREREVEVVQDDLKFGAEVPWGDVGISVDPKWSVDDVLKRSGLDWEVVTQPCFAQYGRKRVDVGRYALLKEDDGRVFDVISEDWRPMQNRDALEFFQEFLSVSDMKVDAIGSLKDGRIVWATSEVPNSSFSLRGDDEVRSYVLFTNPHSYGQSIDMRYMGVRTVSNTALVLPLRVPSKGGVRINHRTSFYPDFVRDTMRVLGERTKAYREAAERSSKKKYDYDQALEFFTSVFPAGPGEDGGSRNATYALERVLDEQPGADMGAGTYWALYNTVCYMTDHVMARTVDNRLQSAWYGFGQRLKVKALELAVK